MNDFIDQTNQRTLPADYRGDVLIWDIDKTYLDTHFSSLKGLVRIPLEWALDKRTLPGSVPLIRALRRGPGRSSALTPLYFISGSPKRMRSVIERKMSMDGVNYDGLTFKDQLGLVLALRPQDVSRQVGFKLQALLRYHRAFPPGVQYRLFGDDAEIDEVIFWMFQRIIEGHRGRELALELRDHRVHDDDVQRILTLSGTLPVHDPSRVKGIYVIQHGRNAPRVDQPHIFRSSSFLTLAEVLRFQGALSNDGVAAVRKDYQLRGVSEYELDVATINARVLWEERKSEEPSKSA
ncbi:MAG: hypothetical protein ACFB9M_02115 [Myxococcota bacterium]